MRKRLIIDDVRVFKDIEGVETFHYLTADDGLDALFLDGPWDEVWLDHDLGWDNVTGTYVVQEIVKAVQDGFAPQVGHWYVHSFNVFRGDDMYNTLRAIGLPVTRTMDIDDMLDWKATDQRSEDMHKHIMENYERAYGSTQPSWGTVVTE